jgi:hypothetical protein
MLQQAAHRYIRGRGNEHAYEVLKATISATGDVHIFTVRVDDVEPCVSRRDLQGPRLRGLHQRGRCCHRIPCVLSWSIECRLEETARGAVICTAARARQGFPVVLTIAYDGPFERYFLSLDQ